MAAVPPSPSAIGPEPRPGAPGFGPVRPDGVAAGGGSPAGLSVAVSRAADAPVFVYRVTDTASGRVVAEVPLRPVREEEPGRVVDASV